jgi:hypothetical protein
MNNIIQLNKFATLHNNKNIYFCKTDFIGALFAQLQNSSTDCTLITGNSDYEINDYMAAHAPSCIKKWYAQNANTTLDLVSGIPMGIENSEHCILAAHGVGWDHAKEKVKVLVDPPEISPTRNLYANFSLSTHPSREMIYQLCKDLKYITTNISLNHSEINNKPYTNYIKDILDHKMVVCPRGNGIDCHRVWEVLYLGRIPIIKKENAMRYFEELPIIILNDWEELQDLPLIEEHYNKVKDNTMRMLDINFWKTKILEESEDARTN